MVIESGNILSKSTSTQTLAKHNVSLDAVTVSANKGLPTKLAILPSASGDHRCNLRFGNLIQIGADFNSSISKLISRLHGFKIKGLLPS
jgi:hypothetical protein